MDIVHRGAEAGGILGVNTPHFLGYVKNGSWRVGDNKILGAGRGQKKGHQKNFGRSGKKTWVRRQKLPNYTFKAGQFEHILFTGYI